MGVILRLPFRLLTASIRFLFHVHWLLGSAALLLFCRMLLMLSGITDLRYLDEFDPSGQLRTIALVQIGVVLYAFLVAPLVPLQRHSGCCDGRRRRGFARSMDRSGEGVHRKFADKARVDHPPGGTSVLCPPRDIDSSRRRTEA